MFVSLRHDDLKEMLDSNKDSLKLEAMKRIVAVSINNVYLGMELISRYGCTMSEGQRSGKFLREAIMSNTMCIIK